MLEISSLDLSKIIKPSSIGSNGSIQQPIKEDSNNTLLSFGAQGKDFSDNDMKKLEEEFLSAANGIGMANPFSDKNSSTDSLEREKEQKIDEIRSLEQEFNTLVAETQSISSNIFERNKDNESGIKIGENDNKNSSINFNSSNIFEQRNEAINKQEAAKDKNQQLGSLIKEAEALDIEIATKSTCGEQGEIPDIKEKDTETAKQTKKDESEKEEAKEVKKTPQDILLDQVNMLANLFPEMNNKSDNPSIFQDTHQKNTVDLESTMKILKKQAEGLPSANTNSSYIQRQKSLFLGLTS